MGKAERVDAGVGTPRQQRCNAASLPPLLARPQVAAAAPHAAAGWNPDGAEQPEVLLGVVASDVRLAVRSLRDYCQALGLPFRVRHRGVAGGGWRSAGARLPATVLCIVQASGQEVLSAAGCALPRTRRQHAPMRQRMCAPRPLAQMPESRVPGVTAAPAIAGPVYLKFNSASGLCYASGWALQGGWQGHGRGSGLPWWR